MKLDPWYVTGLSDGDGSFTFSRSGSVGGLATLYFAVKLTEVDRPLLERLQAYFDDLGTIYDVQPVEAKVNAGWTKRAVYYRVTHLSDLPVVVEHFDRYPPQGRRAEVYAVWRKLYEIRREWRKKKAPIEVVTQFDQLLEHLSSLSPRNRPWAA